MVEIAEIERGQPDLGREPLGQEPVGADPLPLEIDVQRAGRAIGIELAGERQPALKPRAEPADEWFDASPELVLPERAPTFQTAESDGLGEPRLSAGEAVSETAD
jgi:hypothetical protein